MKTEALDAVLSIIPGQGLHSRYHSKNLLVFKSEEAEQVAMTLFLVNTAVL